MRNHRFTFLCTTAERAALERLAVVWRRSKSDTVRLLIVSALEQLFTANQQRDGEATQSSALETTGFHSEGHGGQR